MEMNNYYGWMTDDLKKFLIKEIKEKRGIETYKNLEQAKDNWGYILPLDNKNPLEVIYLLTIETLLDDTQIIKVNNDFYFWLSYELWDMIINETHDEYLGV